MPASALVSPTDPNLQRPPRPAATLIVVRDGHSGPEVLLSRRAERGDHSSGAWVFPGGMVDPSDQDAHSLCAGLDDTAASAQLGLARGGLDYFVAAIRECFEESGLLLAIDAAGRTLVLDDESAVRLDAWRGPLHRGERSLVELCAEWGVRLAVDQLAYVSHWLTPPGRAKRFDTRFFIAAEPPAQTGTHDGTEMLEQLWLRPVDALARSAELKLMTPTRATLETLTRFDRAESALAWARVPREVALIMPRIGEGKGGARPVMPSEPAWAEIGRLDPAGHGHVACEIQPGAAVRLSQRLIRVSANNGSMMTGPGTNTYLVGSGESNEWAAIDPGPLDATHVDAIQAAAPGAIRWIFVTHTHTDHSPATVLLRERTGARVFGRLAKHPDWQDATFRPDTLLADGERIKLGSATTLRVIHTPGHASNHLCYLLEEEKTLFTGDHVMQASTVVINPPDGDMAAYLASLRALLAADLDWLAPGHGFLMADPRRAIQSIINHRGKREAKVVEALRACGPASAAALLARVYDDVPVRLHPVAMRSMLAHLFKLRDEAVANECQAQWSLAEGA